MVEARTSLWYLVFIGFAVNYMIRINLNITIVDMIKNRNRVQQKSSNNNRKLLNECLATTSSSLVVIDIKKSDNSNHHIHMNSIISNNNNSNSDFSDSNDTIDSTKLMNYKNLNNYLRDKLDNNYNNSDNLYINNNSSKNYDTISNNGNKINNNENKTIIETTTVANFNFDLINLTTTIINESNIEKDVEISSNGSRSNSSTSRGNSSKNTEITINEKKVKNNTKFEKLIIFDVNEEIDRCFTIERFIFDSFNIKYEKNGFNWNEYEQGLVLGAFFWLHWITQIPGGLLAKKYGTKLIFGLANTTGCWICFLLPFVSYIDYRLLIFFRVLQGLICGLAWPAMHHMTAQWIPPNERSKFVTAYLGSSIGIAIFYPLFGYIMSWITWEWVYHLCGIIGTIWYIMWLYMVYDTPSKHPRISEKERKYIEISLNGESITNDNNNDKNLNKNDKIPWRHILKSKPVWMNVIAQWGGIWGLFTLMTQAPTYFKLIHGWDIKMTGILSGLPHLMRMIFAYFFSMLGDHLLKTEKMSRTNVRKMATTMCCIIKGIFVFALAYSGCNSTAAILFLTLATAVHGAVSTGPLASIVDIAPNYAGIILGISGMIGVLPGFISPVIVGILTYENQTITSWKYVFLITSGMLIISGILYVLLCESNTQKWNNYSKLIILFENEKLIENKEMKLIIKNNNDLENIKNYKKNNNDCINYENKCDIINNDLKIINDDNLNKNNDYYPLLNNVEKNS